MRSTSQKRGDGGTQFPGPGKDNNGIIPNSFKALSSYLRIVSSGASTVARSAASAASAIMEKDNETNPDQVAWAGFDKLELEGGVIRQVLLLGYSYGFEVWDVESADNVHNLVFRHDGPVSFLQMLPKPVAAKQAEDKFADSRPLLIVCADKSFSGDENVQEGSGIPYNGSTQQCNGSVDSVCVPTVVWFYSLRSQSYVHLLRFRSVVHLVRCSSRVVAILQSNQIHCFNAGTLEREYTILTNPVVTGCYASGSTGFGPLAVGPRWMAYSGSQVLISNSGRVNPQHLTPSASFPCSASNGSLANYAKESGKQLAAGLVTFGDKGCKKLSRYYSELLFPEGNNCQAGTAHAKVHGVTNGHLPDAENVGMVIVRDIVSKTVIAQFRAHKSPISSLSFDPSGTLLVTASVHGHNINVFRIMPGLSGGSSGDASGHSYVHLYKLQRGFTNAVIQDISFSSDSQWIMISSSRGTSHLFAVSPSGGMINFQSMDGSHSARNSGSSVTSEPAVRGSPNSGLQVLTQQSICDSGSPVTLSAISRIRNGNNGWRNAVSGAAATAAGRMNSISGTIASTFHNSKGNNMHVDTGSLSKSYYLLVFSPSGSVIQYALRTSPAYNGMLTSPGATATCDSGVDCDSRLMVEAVQKWNICRKQNRKEREDNSDLYGEHVNSDSSKVYPERLKLENNACHSALGTTRKEKITAEERHHIYISEAELQMHQNRNPLWARSEIYFQSMLTDGFDMEEEGAHGELEIEKVPIRTLVARSKDLVPVWNYNQAPKLQQERVYVMNHTTNDQFQGHEIEDSKLGCGSSSGSIDSIANGGTLVNESGNMSRILVNTCETPVENTQIDSVHTRQNSVNERQFTSVHNRDSLQNQNRFTADDEID